MAVSQLVTHSGNQPQQIPSCSSAIPGRSPPHPHPAAVGAQPLEEGRAGPTLPHFQVSSDGGSRQSLLPRKMGWGLRASWQFVDGAGYRPWSHPCWEAPPRRILRRSHGRLESWSVLAERSQQAKGESSTQDLPDLLRKVPTAVGAAFSATGNTEGWGGWGGGWLSQWPSSRVSHEVRN